MKIKWLETAEIVIYVGENDETGHIEQVNQGETEEITIINKEKGRVYIQFGDGSVAFCVPEEGFEIIEK